MRDKPDVDVHRKHLDRVFVPSWKHKLYANLKKCIFGASEIFILGCFGCKNGVRPDPDKTKTVTSWPTPKSVKDLRKFVGLAT